MPTIKNPRAAKNFLFLSFLRNSFIFFKLFGFFEKYLHENAKELPVRISIQLERN